METLARSERRSPLLRHTGQTASMMSLPRRITPKATRTSVSQSTHMILPMRSSSMDSFRKRLVLACRTDQWTKQELACYFGTARLVRAGMTFIPFPCGDATDFLLTEHADHDRHFSPLPRHVALNDVNSFVFWVLFTDYRQCS